MLLSKSEVRTVSSTTSCCCVCSSLPTLIHDVGGKDSDLNEEEMKGEEEGIGRRASDDEIVRTSASERVARGV